MSNSWRMMLNRWKNVVYKKHKGSLTEYIIHPFWANIVYIFFGANDSLSEYV